MRFINTSHSLLLVLACGILLVSPNLNAQESDYEDVTNWRTVELDFKGGTVADYIKVLKATVKSANIMVDPRAANVPLSKIELREVDLFAAIQFLDGTMEQVDGELVQIDVNYNPPNNPHAMGIWMIRGETRGNRPQPVRTHVMSVADLLQGEAPMSSETVLSAVEIGLSLAPRTDVQGTIRFHEETGLLMAKGHVDQLETIESVVSQLRQSRETQLQGYVRDVVEMERQQARADRSALRDEYEARLQRASVQIAELSTQMKVLEDTIQDMREALVHQRRESEQNMDMHAAERAELESTVRQQQAIITELRLELSNARGTKDE